VAGAAGRQPTDDEAEQVVEVGDERVGAGGAGAPRVVAFAEAAGDDQRRVGQPAQLRVGRGGDELIDALAAWEPDGAGAMLLDPREIAEAL